MKNLTTIIAAIFLLTSITTAQNYSLSFDGSDDYVDLPNDMLAYDEPRTILLQVKTQGDGGTLYSSYTNQSGEYRISSESNGSYFTLKGSNGNWVTAGENTSLITDEWLYIIGVWDLSEIRIYENENLIDSTPLTGTLAQNTFNGNTGIGVSAAHYNGFYNGNIAKTAVWNRSLSESEITNIVQGADILNYSNSLIAYWNFNEGTGTTLTDQTSNGNDGTIDGATWSDDVP